MKIIFIQLLVLFSFASVWAQGSVPPKSIIVAITGGTASGKSYMASRLAARLTAERALHFSLDNYNDKRVQAREFYLEEGKPNWDHPSLVNWSLAREQLEALKTWRNSSGADLWNSGGGSLDWMEVHPKPVIIIEGLHALGPELKQTTDLKVFLEVSQGPSL